MAPKLKKDRSSGSVGPKRKTLINAAERSPEVEFCESFSTESPIEDVQKLVKIMTEAVSKKNATTQASARYAVRRCCGDDGGEMEHAQFLAFVRTEGLEALGYMAKEGSKDGRADTEAVMQVVFDGAQRWLEEIDVIDFPEIANIAFLLTTMAPHCNDVAHACFAAAERFISYRGQNGALFLDHGLVRACHVLLRAHPSPEFCHEVVSVLFCVCDVPGDYWAAFVAKESGIVKTIMHILRDQQLHMKLQLAAFRLMCLWNGQEEYPPEMPIQERMEVIGARDKIRHVMLDQKAHLLVRRAADSLERGGLSNQAAWMNTVASNLLAEDMLKPRIDELYQAQRGG